MPRPQTLYRSPKGATFLEGPKLTPVEIAAGTPPKLREAGRMLDGALTMAAEPVIRYEWAVSACTALEEKRHYPQKMANLTVSLRSASDAKNILLAWQGQAKSEPGSTTQTDEPTRDDIVAGDTHRLALPSDGAATITDSEGTPNPAVEGTHWEWLNGSAQIIRILDVTGLTLPLLVTYDTAAAEEIGLMTDMGSGHHVVIQATNAEADCGQEFLELYNVIPEGDYEDVIGVAPDSTDENPATINFIAYAHRDMPADPVLGTIGRIIR